MKTSQNTKISEIDIIANSATETMPFRYLFASHWCHDKDVADVSCGYGYGTALLKALGANNVTGMDIDDDALEYATAHYMAEYSDGSTVSFEKINLLKDTKVTQLYDTVLSIETFEHLPKDSIQIYLENLKHLCEENGYIIITTPRRRKEVWTNDGGTHEYEYSFEEFDAEIKTQFEDYTVAYTGIKEIRAGQNQQLISLLTNDVYESRIMIAIIEKKPQSALGGVKLK